MRKQVVCGRSKLKRKQVMHWKSSLIAGTALLALVGCGPPDKSPGSPDVNTNTPAQNAPPTTITAPNPTNISQVKTNGPPSASRGATEVLAIAEGRRDYFIATTQKLRELDDKISELNRQAATVNGETKQQA